MAASSASTGQGVQYSYAQLEYIWEQAGGSAQAAPMAAAIAMAESGGWSGAYNNDSNGTQDRGLWQINTVNGSWSSFDVMTNARGAVAISGNGTNWEPWTTYQTGAYQQFLQGNVSPQSAPINGTNAAANNAGGNTGTGATLTAQLTSAECSGWSQYFDLNCLFQNAQNAIAEDALKAIFNLILNPIIQLVSGFTGILAGATMMVFGIWHLAKQSNTVQDTQRDMIDLGSMFAAPEAEPEVAGAEAARASQASGRTAPGQGRNATARRRFQQDQTQQTLRDQATEYGPPQNGSSS